tara:strand:- start:1236 stop:1679 length:444 start_codon:yes stop_codon:yes gene_type:complete
LENIERNGGRVDDEAITIAVQPFTFEGEREISFVGMEFVETFKALDPALQWHGDWDVEDVRKRQAGGEVVISSSTPGDYVEVVFNGTCIYMQGNLHSKAVWVTGLNEGQHTLKVAISLEKNAASSGTEIALGRVVSYRGAFAGEGIK